MTHPAGTEAKRKPRGRPAILSPTANDTGVAARHGCMLLVAAEPHLWNLLNAATLGDRPDWVSVHRQLQGVTP